LGIEKIKFKKGKFNLPVTAGAALNKLITHLSDNPNLKIEIKIHFFVSFIFIFIFVF
jgi:hypothetical protein